MVSSDNFFWLTMLAILLAAAALGAYSYRAVSRRYSHNNDVRWRRMLKESKQEHEREYGKLKKSLDHALQKESDLRQALDESEETVRLLSAKHVPAYESEIAGRNQRLAELEKRLSHTRARLADAKDQEETYQREIQDLRVAADNKDELRKQLAVRQSEVADLTRLKEEAEQRVAMLQRDLDLVRQLQVTAQSDHRKQLAEKADAAEKANLGLAELHKQIGNLEKDKLDHQAEIEERDRQIAALNHEIEQMRRRLPALNDALQDREASIENLIAELLLERKETGLLQQRVGQARTKEPVEIRRAGPNVIDLQPNPDADMAASNQQPGDAEERIRALEAELNEWKRKHDAVNRKKDHIVSTLSATHRQKTVDSLQRIRGIGPVLEVTLNNLGIVSLNQLASLDRDKIAAMAKHDSSLPRRINRESWIEQARELMQSEQHDRRRPRA